MIYEILYFITLTACSQLTYVDINLKHLPIKDFLSKKPILKSELIGIINAILEEHNMTLVNKKDYYMVVNIDSIVCGIPLSKKKKVNLKMITKNFPLNHLDGKMLQIKIKPLLSKNTEIVFLKEENVFVVTSTSEGLRMIDLFLKKMKKKI